MGIMSHVVGLLAGVAGLMLGYNLNGQPGAIAGLLAGWIGGYIAGKLLSVTVWGVRTALFVGGSVTGAAVLAAAAFMMWGGAATGP